MRFGFELIEYTASLYNCEIEIIDNTEKSEQEEADGKSHKSNADTKQCTENWYVMTFVKR